MEKHTALEDDLEKVRAPRRRSRCPLSPTDPRDALCIRGRTDHGASLVRADDATAWP
jgi:hypothetical protein